MRGQGEGNQKRKGQGNFHTPKLPEPPRGHNPGRDELCFIAPAWQKPAVPLMRLSFATGRKAHPK
jgi:hypothetical protein